MERLTYDFALGGNHCWQVKGADNLECREVCERQGDDGCKTCPIAKAFDRLAAIEDILCDGTDDYDLERLAAVYNQRVSMRDEVSQRFSLTAKIPLDRLREIAEAERDGRCVVLPCKRYDILWTFFDSPPKTVYSFYVTDISTLNGRTMLNTDIAGVVDARDIGKTVFRTRAEAALAKERT